MPMNKKAIDMDMKDLLEEIPSNGEAKFMGENKSKTSNNYKNSLESLKNLDLRVENELSKIKEKLTRKGGKVNKRPFEHYSLQDTSESTVKDGREYLNKPQSSLFREDLLSCGRYRNSNNLNTYSPSNDSNEVNYGENVESARALVENLEAGYSLNLEEIEKLKDLLINEEGGTVNLEANAYLNEDQSIDMNNMPSSKPMTSKEDNGDNNNNEEEEEVEENTWCKIYSESHGLYYYANTLTGETSWEKPENFTDEKVLESMEDKEASSKSNTTESTTKETSKVCDNFNRYQSQRKHIQNMLRNEEIRRAKLIKLREDQNASEIAKLKELSNKTIVNQESRKLLEKQGNIDLRSLPQRASEYLSKVKQKRESLKHKLSLQEVEGFVGKPMINSRSKVMDRKVEDMMKWKEDVERKKKMMQDIQRAKDEEEMRKDLVLVAQKKSKNRVPDRFDEDESPCSENDLLAKSHSQQEKCARLHAAAEEIRIKREKKKEEEERKLKASAIPKVAPHSVALPRDKNVSIVDRLYGLAVAKQQQEKSKRNMNPLQKSNAMTQEIDKRKGKGPYKFSQCSYMLHQQLRSKRYPIDQSLFCPPPPTQHANDDILRNTKKSNPMEKQGNNGFQSQEPNIENTVFHDHPGENFKGKKEAFAHLRANIVKTMQLERESKGQSLSLNKNDKKAQCNQNIMYRHSVSMGLARPEEDLSKNLSISLNCDKIEDLLQLYAYKYELNREKRVAKEWNTSRMLANKKKIGHKSDVLAAKMAFRNNLTLEQRLTAPIGKKLKKTTINDLQQQMPSFKPTIIPYSNNQNNADITHNLKHERENGDSEQEKEFVMYKDVEYDENDNIQAFYERGEQSETHQTENNVHNYSSEDYEEGERNPNKNAQLSSQYNKILEARAITEKDPLLARMQAWDNQRKQRLEAERVHREEETLSQCTFAPNLVASQNYKAKSRRLGFLQTPISEKEFLESEEHEYNLDSNDDVSQTITNHNNNTAGTIWERQEEWIRKRDLKLKKERELKEEKALEGCSFQPCLATNTTDLKGGISRHHRQKSSTSDKATSHQIEISRNEGISPNSNNNNNNNGQENEEENLDLPHAPNRTSAGGMYEKNSCCDSYLERYFQESCAQKQHRAGSHEERDFINDETLKAHQFSSDSETETEYNQIQNEDGPSFFAKRKIDRLEESDNEQYEKETNSIAIDQDQESEMPDRGASVDSVINDYISAELVSYLHTNYRKKLTSNSTHNSESSSNENGTQNLHYVKTNEADRTKSRESLCRPSDECQREGEDEDERDSNVQVIERENSMPLPYKMKNDQTTESIITEDSTIFEEDIEFESSDVKLDNFFALNKQTSPKATTNGTCGQQNKNKLKFLSEQYSSETDTTVVTDMQSVRTADGGMMRFGGLLPSNYLEFNTKDGKVYYYNTETQESTWDFPFC